MWKSGLFDMGQASPWHDLDDKVTLYRNNEQERGVTAQEGALKKNKCNHRDFRCILIRTEQR